MTQPAITVDGLWKEYAVGKALHRPDTFYELVSQSVRATFKRIGELRSNANQCERFWALRDVSLEAHPGEVTGIIGRNGAGKSTLLKILSRVTAPTRGRATIRGRMVSLLEVGTGFHPELTGRENVYLNGALLGMGRAEISDRFDEIVAFAEVERFIDTPVKRYSSGMYVRLAFAIAAHLEPDVLIIDEVLAVGDAAFQRKCLGKMESVAGQQRSVIVVSHNMSVVTQLCEKVIWLDKGNIVAVGETASVVSKYMSQGLSGCTTWRPDVAASDAFEYHEVTIAHDSDGHEAFAADEQVRLVFDFTVKGTLTPGRLAFRIAREDGMIVLTSSNTDTMPNVNAAWRTGRHRLSCTLPSDLLPPAKYFVTISEPAEVGNVLHENVLAFTVTDQNSLVARDRREGVIAPKLDWREER